MKKFLKWAFILLAVFLLILTVIGFMTHESKPTANQSAAADQLAQKMMAAVNKTAWDTTNIISWNFAGRNQYLWDKGRNFVKVVMGKNTVLLNTKAVDGIAFKDGKELSGKSATTQIQAAWKNFCNDSFWLNAVVKAFDPGTKRSIVNTKDGREGLMVHYESGGVTPGDSYVWLLDENGMPKSYKMWVKIIPVGGLEFTWQDWVTLDTGAKVASLHKSKVFDIPVTEIKGTTSLQAHGLDEDPFAQLSTL